MTYPIAGGELFNVVALERKQDNYGEQYEGPWVRETTRDEILDNYSNWDPDVRALLEVYIHTVCP